MTQREFIHDSGQPLERGYLVGIFLKGSHPLLRVEDSLQELEQLAMTAEIEVVGKTHQQLQKPHPATLIGPGKVEEVRESVEQFGANVVIFDDELSPHHQRELEKAFGENVKIIDRSALILDIFARHAQTREGALQVELAQYEYRLPRLTGQWAHLARQAGGGAARAGAGGVGLRGPGETQLEVDRREISRRIIRLKRDLEAVRAHRSRYRQQRKQAGIPLVALVGYTNAGKSTLLNALAQSDVHVADQLFATLDPTTRRLILPGGQVVLCTDTVGFIQKLPTTLIAAFRATLEEIAEATLLLHVADASHPNVHEQIEAVEDTLAELDLPRIPRILVLNKIDLLSRDKQSTLSEEVPHQDYVAVVSLSAKNATGLIALQEQIERVLSQGTRRIRLLVPYERGDVITQIHAQGLVLREEHTDHGVILEANLKSQIVDRLAAVEGISFLSSK